MPKVRWVVLYRFCSTFHNTFQQCKNFENRLRYDKVTESSKVGTFFETQCMYVCLLDLLGGYTAKNSLYYHLPVTSYHEV